MNVSGVSLRSALAQTHAATSTSNVKAALKASIASSTSGASKTDGDGDHGIEPKSQPASNGKVGQFVNTLA